jgi:hypothetical protein
MRSIPRLSPQTDMKYLKTDKLLPSPWVLCGELPRSQPTGRSRLLWRKLSWRERLLRVVEIILPPVVLAATLLAPVKAEELRARGLWAYTSLPQFAMPAPMASLEEYLAAVDVQNGGGQDSYLDSVLYGSPINR